MRLCACLKAVCFRRRKEKISPQTTGKDTHKIEPKKTLSIRYEKNNLSITVLSDEQGEEVKRLHKVPKAAKSAGKSRPKVYSVLKGTNSICHTPVPDVGASHPPIIRRGEPRSALLVSDSQAKQTLLRLKAGRSHSEDQGGVDSPMPTP